MAPVEMLSKGSLRLNAEEGSCGLGPRQSACTSGVGGRIMLAVTVHRGSCSSSRNSTMNTNSVWQGPVLFSVLSLNLITHARAFQTFGCKLLEMQLIFLRRTHSRTVGGEGAERWRAMQTAGCCATCDSNGGGKGSGRHQGGLVGGAMACSQTPLVGMPELPLPELWPWAGTALL